MARLALLAAFLLFTVPCSMAQSGDSLRAAPAAAAGESEKKTVRRADNAVNRSWFLVPIGFYQEETSVGLGITGGYYLPSRHLNKISSISGSFTYTFLNQAKINLNPRFYFAGNKVYLTGNVNLRHYPDKFFGISNTATGEVYDYIARSFVINVQPFYSFRPEIMLGPYLDFRGEQLLHSEQMSADLPRLQSEYGPAGWDRYFMWGWGLQFMYDGRDNAFYPQKFSNFAKFSVLSYTKALGSTYDVTMLTLDFRQYVPTWRGQVFAWQLYASAALGGAVPFRMLPYLGGSDMMRGFRERLYTGNFIFALQAEYRIHIYSRLKAAVFCSVGDALNVYDPHINKIKVGYGAGLRFRLNDARVHLRVDFAGNNYGEFKFYITATEAF